MAANETERGRRPRDEDGRPDDAPGEREKARDRRQRGDDEHSGTFRIPRT